MNYLFLELDVIYCEVSYRVLLIPSNICESLLRVVKAANRKETAKEKVNIVIPYSCLRYLRINYDKSRAN